jgi:hypothetical protein
MRFTSRFSESAPILAGLFAAGCAFGTLGQAPNAGGVGAPPSTLARDRPAVEAAVNAVLDDWHDAAADADFARYFGHLADDSIFLGTDATERWTKAAFEAYARPAFEKGKAWTFRAKRRAILVTPDGSHAWFDEDLDTLGLGPARGSGVLALRGEKWIILHYNLTITVPNDRFDLVKEAAGPATILQAPADDPVAKLAWLSGSWVGTPEEGERVEESWLPPTAKTMIGSNRAVKNGETGFFEHLRIVVRDKKLIYVAQPLGKPPTEFVELPSTEPDTVVFENKKHDWPKRITYKKNGTDLAVKVEGDPGQRSVSFTMAPAVIARRQAPASGR